MSDLYINVLKGNIFTANKNVKGNISTANMNVKGSLKLPERVSTGDYNELVNRPQINNVELIGNKLSEDLGLEPTIHDITEQDIDNLIYGG